jgi:hypothetical protein
MASQLRIVVGSGIRRTTQGRSRKVTQATLKNKSISSIRILLAAFVFGLALGPVACSGGGAGEAVAGGPGPAPAPAPPPGPSPPTGEAISLAWDSPTHSNDGSGLTDLAGFKIYDGNAPGNYAGVTDVGNVTHFTTDPYQPGTYYFSVTAYDSIGNESDFSNEIVVTVDSAP